MTRAPSGTARTSPPSRLPRSRGPSRPTVLRTASAMPGSCPARSRSAGRASMRSTRRPRSSTELPLPPRGAAPRPPRATARRLSAPW
eukprot:12085392-Alexandrium_andersonii.AAC.1